MTEKDPRTFAIIGAAMEVHRELGCGFLEAVYQEALALEFARRGLPYLEQVDIPVRYKAATLKTHYRADFVCYQDIIVEAKALTALSTFEEAQVLNYLKATGMQTGLLLNFGTQSLVHRRFIAHQSWKRNPGT